MTAFQIIERHVRRTGDGVGERTPQCEHPGCTSAGRYKAGFLDYARFHLCAKHRVEYAEAWDRAKTNDWHETA